jgi:hypothetical protein
MSDGTTTHNGRVFVREKPMEGALSMASLGPYCTKLADIALISF